MRQVFTEVFLVAAINSKLMLSPNYCSDSHTGSHENQTRFWASDSKAQKIHAAVDVGISRTCIQLSKPHIGSKSLEDMFL